MTAAAFLPGLWLACLLDLIVGDPRRLPHPVMLIAWIASGLESFFKTILPAQVWAGRLTVCCTLFTCILGIGLLFFVLLALSPWLLFIGSVVLLYTTFALRSLTDHAMAVYDRLNTGGAAAGDLQPARESVGLIVGRETAHLDEAGIIRACVESVAENMSDGVIAPLFFAFLGALLCSLTGEGALSPAAGATASMLYKAVNTMDSMFGYKNEKYLYFGRAAARLDDMFNWIPARLTAFGLVLASILTRGNGRSAWKILQRDKRRHASPNAGYPEAAMAGALGIQLGGTNRYFGKLVAKPTLGDRKFSPVHAHIREAVRLMQLGSLFILLVLSILYYAVL